MVISTKCNIECHEDNPAAMKTITENFALTGKEERKLNQWNIYENLIKKTKFMRKDQTQRVINRTQCNAREHTVQTVITKQV